MSASGLLILDKPAGVTSHDVVARVRRTLGTRKVGHAGTLDPMATGVLVIGVERATRLLGHLALRDKRYRATIRLGSATVTDDREGQTLTVADAADVAAVSEAAIRAGLAALTGTVQQRPSSVSAVKVDGRRAYDRVRAGETVALEPRTVEIARIDVLGVDRGSGHIDVDVDVECSTGTYIRAIARDLGESLGVGGHLTSLRRTRVGPFDRPLALDLLDEQGEAALLPMSVVARACFPTWELDEGRTADVRNGRRIPWLGPEAGSGPVALLAPDGGFVALAADEEGTARYLAVLG